MVWSVGWRSGGSGTVGWRASGWCRRGCWNGEGGGVVAGRRWAGGWLDGVKVTEREKDKRSEERRVGKECRP